VGIYSKALYNLLGCVSSVKYGAAAATAQSATLLTDAGPGPREVKSWIAAI